MTQYRILLPLSHIWQVQSGAARKTRSVFQVGLFLLGILSAHVACAGSKVLVIGIDGAGGSFVIDANTPNLDALAAAGTARYDFLNEGALTPNPPAGYGASGVNWSTILTGASAAHHGVVDNSFSGNDYAEYPHFFKYVKQFDGGLYTASLANWTPINTEIVPDEYADLEIGYDSGTGEEQDSLVKSDAVALLQSNLDPDVIFLHFDEVDGAGHSYSWGSPQYVAAIENVDSLIGEIMSAVNSRPGVISGEEDWLVMVTADHGGEGYSHFASQGPINWEVPFVVSGPSVPNGTGMQQGSLRDVAATALWHLGIDPFLAGLDGTIRGLPIHPPSGIDGDINQDGQVFGNGTGPVESDDVTAFLSHWLASGVGGIGDRYARGDLNFDGITDLSDWALLNSLDPSMGSAVFRALQSKRGTVPEPSSGLIAAAAASLLSGAVRRRPVPAPESGRLRH
jgi:hypothetical protein